MVDKENTTTVIDVYHLNQLFHYFQFYKIYNNKKIYLKH